MNKYTLNSLQDKIIHQLNSEEENKESTIYQLYNGQILKVFTPAFVKLHETNNTNNLEEKIKKVPSLNLPKEIIKPTDLIYDNQGMFRGYLMPQAYGIGLEKYLYQLNFFDQTLPETYNKIYKRIENIIEKANQEGVVFPDICSASNIIYNPRSNQISLIDIDGMQIKNTPSITFLSEALGDKSQYENTKYKQNNLYTSELDKKSLIIHYFAYTFGIDLSRIGQLDPKTNQPITIKQKMQEIKLNDPQIINIVKTAFSTTGNNSFITDEMSKYNYTHSLLPNHKCKVLVPGRIKFF